MKEEIVSKVHDQYSIGNDIFVHTVVTELLLFFQFGF